MLPRHRPRSRRDREVNAVIRIALVALIFLATGATKAHAPSNPWAHAQPATHIIKSCSGAKATREPCGLIKLPDRKLEP